MKTYDYHAEIRNDVRNYIQENEIKVTFSNRDEIEEKLNADLWLDDSVTGNGSGSYTFSAWQAEENLCHNWGLLEECAEEWGEDVGRLFARGAEVADVCIRCYLLAGAISDVLDEVCEEEEEEEEA